MNFHPLKIRSFLAISLLLICCTNDPCKNLLGEEKRNCEYMRTVIQIDELLMKHNGQTKPPKALATYLKSTCLDSDSFESYGYQAAYKGDGNYIVRVRWSSSDSYGKVIKKLSEFLINENGNVTSFKNY